MRSPSRTKNSPPGRIDCHHLKLENGADAEPVEVELVVVLAKLCQADQLESVKRLEIPKVGPHPNVLAEEDHQASPHVVPEIILVFVHRRPSGRVHLTLEEAEPAEA